MGVSSAEAVCPRKESTGRIFGDFSLRDGKNVLTLLSPANAGSSTVNKKNNKIFFFINWNYRKKGCDFKCIIVCFMFIKLEYWEKWNNHRF